MAAPPPSETKDKDKKGGKKDSKNPKEEAVAASTDESKPIETVKTWRQKSVFTAREEVLASIHTQFQEMLNRFQEAVEKGLADNESFRLKWRSIAEPLYIT